MTIISPIIETPPEQEWGYLLLQLLEQAQQITDSYMFNRSLRLYQYNDIATMIATTEPGQRVGASTLTKERAEEISAMFQSFLAWRETPIPVRLDEQGAPVLLSPIAVMSKRQQ